jgi:S-adenosylmethionine decarboxylase
VLSARRSVGLHQGSESHSVHVEVDGVYEPPLPVPEPRFLRSPSRTPGSLPGVHLLLEMNNARFLTDSRRIIKALRQASKDAHANLLAVHHHIFTPDGGVTAFALLAESHISIHTWPESSYAALDIFMCGACDPLACLPALTSALLPSRLVITRVMRGIASCEALALASD